MATLIVRDPIPLAELRRLAIGGFGDFVKAVVDVEAEVMALGGELHADQETMLLEQGSQQRNLWGINLYPDLPATERVEFDSMINVRPSQGNRSRSVESEVIRHQIEDIVSRLVRE
ncbi:MAG: DUF5674 family protein [Gemmatimonadaceae bacterium]